MLPLTLLLIAVLAVILSAPRAAGYKAYIKDPEFQYGDESAKVVIYRLIGNDMPPLQVGYFFHVHISMNATISIGL